MRPGLENAFAFDSAINGVRDPDRIPVFKDAGHKLFLDGGVGGRVEQVSGFVRIILKIEQLMPVIMEVIQFEPALPDHACQDFPAPRPCLQPVCTIFAERLVLPIDIRI